MCGRFDFMSRPDPELEQILRDARKRSGDREQDFHPGEIAPGCTVPVLIARGEKVVGDFQIFGRPGVRNGLIFNARAETVTQKPMFAKNIAAQRCVIPISGFYEWDSGRHKYYFTTPGQKVTYLAGIYDSTDSGNCFVILTTAPNETMQPIHDRMPLTLTHEQVRQWLTDPVFALQMLASTPPLLDRESCDGQLSMWAD